MSSNHAVPKVRWKFVPMNWVSGNRTMVGHGGDHVISVLALYSNYPSSNPALVYNFSIILLLERTKISQKRPGLTHLKTVLCLIRFKRVVGPLSRTDRLAKVLWVTIGVIYSAELFLPTNFLELDIFRYALVITNGKLLSSILNHCPMKNS